MKRELVIQLLILAAAVCLLLFTLYRHQQVVPVERPDERLLDLQADFARTRGEAPDASESEVLPVPTPFPQESRRGRGVETEY